MSKIPAVPLKDPEESLIKELIIFIFICIFGYYLADYIGKSHLPYVNTVLKITMPLALVGALFLLLIAYSLIKPKFVNFKIRRTLDKLSKKYPESYKKTDS